MPKAVAQAGQGPIKQTPMLRQYLEQKANYPDCILFFRLGDFYEMFFEDAELASRVLDIALTARANAAESFPMCGVPFFSASAYVARLVAAGHKVAICDQLEDAKLAKGLVKRAVTRVVSPGMITDPEELDAAESNFLAAVVAPGPDGVEGFGLACLDVSTADFRMAPLPDLGALLDELGRVRPRELVLARRHEGGELPRALGERCRGLFVRFSDLASDKERAGQARFSAEFDEASLLGPEPEALRPALEAARAVYAYAAASLPASLEHVRRLVPYEVGEHLVLDEFARTNLELVETLMEGKRRGSLLGLLDRSLTPMGARLMGRWMLYPLLDPEAIGRRLDAVEQLVEDGVQRHDLRAVLGGIRDLERLLAKASVGQASARDLGALRDSLAKLPAWAEAVLRPGGERPLARLLGPVQETLEALAGLHTELDRTLVDAPPVDLVEGGAIRPGCSARLDELVRLASSGRDFIAELEARERARTGIGSLKIRYNRVFGYFIEVTRPNLHLVPADYRRKQTTAHAERFETEELGRWERQVVTAHEDRVALERELVAGLVQTVRAAAAPVLQGASLVAGSDVLAALAELAAERGYCRPAVDRSELLEIRDGRHPMVEHALREGRFVPNDVRIECDAEQLLVITGPNMAGKSTAIRQVALIAILAQMGSFVPAGQARVGVVDRIFTRIGAADNLSRGQSTFMVEMVETAHILRHATRRSLIVLDEIGRGTSTFDGLSIAWAVAEYIHDRIGARSLFATHYHQLADLALTKARVANHTVSVKEWKDQIIFLRRLVKGVSNRSYGIQVGKLAGLPAEVIQRAREVLANLEGQELDELGRPRLSRTSQASEPAGRAPAQLQLFGGGNRSALEEELRRLDLDGLTPLEALALLHRWKEELKG
jgi:DNA mismatch repair protein MutS